MFICRYVCLYVGSNPRPHLWADPDKREVLLTDLGGQISNHPIGGDNFKKAAAEVPELF